MTEEETFPSAILRDPEDDLPRVVYADWLEENAESVPCRTCSEAGRVGRYEYDAASDETEWAGTDPCPVCKGTGAVSDNRAARARFIRVQCELARLESVPCSVTAGTWVKSQFPHHVLSTGRMISEWPNSPPVRCCLPYNKDDETGICLKCARIDQLTREENGLWVKNGREWFHTPGTGFSAAIADAAGTVDPGNVVGSFKADTIIVRRGFGAELRVPNLSRLIHPRTGYPTVVAADLFARHPITRIRAGDVTIHIMPFSGTSIILPPVFSRLISPDLLTGFHEPESAIEYFSRELVNVIRDFVLLPPIPNRTEFKT